MVKEEEGEERNEIKNKQDSEKRDWWEEENIEGKDSKEEEGEEKRRMGIRIRKIWRRRKEKRREVLD